MPSLVSGGRYQEVFGFGHEKQDCLAMDDVTLTVRLIRSFEYRNIRVRYIRILVSDGGVLLRLYCSLEYAWCNNFV